MVQIPYRRELTFEYGRPDRLSPLIRRVIANNPSAFTFHGTGTYIVGQGEVAVIDPGPNDPAHVQAILDAVKGERVTHLVVTHTHRDHSPAAAPLKAATGAKTYGFGPHGSGRPDAEHAGEDVEEGGDSSFVPDVRVRDGDAIRGAGWTLEAVWTPGHTSNHLCYRLVEENVLFPGDHVMGWSTTIVSPPDGDMAAYMASLRKLAARGETAYWPTHGPQIPEPQAFVRALIAHREAREAQIVECLKAGVGAIPAMVERMYVEVDRRLHPAAARSVLAHLIHMVEDGRAACDDDRPRARSRYRSP